MVMDADVEKTVGSYRENAEFPKLPESIEAVAFEPAKVITGEKRSKYLLW